jgi:hypothetical protein
MLKLMEGMPVLNVEICVEGWIDQHWSEWFEGLEISYLEEQRTLLSGMVVDQTALYTLIARLYRLGLPLVSVKTFAVANNI